MTEVVIGLPCFPKFVFGYRIKQSVTESILAENISPKNVPYHPCQGLILGGFFNYFEQKWQNVTYATPN